MLSNDVRQRSLAATRRAPQDQRRDAIGLNSATQQLAGAYNFLLSDILSEIARSHAHSQRRLPFRISLCGAAEQIQCQGSF